MSGCSSERLVNSSGISLLKKEYLSIRSSNHPPTVFVTAIRTAGFWSNNLWARWETTVSTDFPFPYCMTSPENVKRIVWKCWFNLVAFIYYTHWFTSMVVLTLYIAVPSSDLLDNGLATHQKRAFLNLQTTKNTLFSQSKHLFTILLSEIYSISGKQWG